MRCQQEILNREFAERARGYRLEIVVDTFALHVRVPLRRRRDAESDDDDDGKYIQGD